ncbi:hypothetical protein HK100_000860 [Physocladia obscura]|uniref:Uncharacterized protein n=1 Tax=Physocladia obscura TaxID=109957 RepID=A0AAD5SZB1_9FUNG|nr:hypothetical protein HK100_000860 [Physocladia obscura]
MAELGETAADSSQIKSGSTTPELRAATSSTSLRRKSMGGGFTSLLPGATPITLDSASLSTTTTFPTEPLPKPESESGVFGYPTEPLPEPPSLTYAYPTEPLPDPLVQPREAELPTPPPPPRTSFKKRDSDSKSINGTVFSADVIHTAAFRSKRESSIRSADSRDGRSSNQALQELFRTTQCVKFNDPDFKRLSLKNSLVLTTARALTLAKALATNTYLVQLNLQNTQLETQVAIEFATALKINTALRILNLDGNFIGSAGIKAIAKALPYNNSLRELLLNEQVSLTQETQEDVNDAEQELVSGISKNESLLKVSFPFHSAAIRATVDQALLRNTILVHGRRG